jgi:hypothetical protein
MLGPSGFDACHLDDRLSDLVNTDPIFVHAKTNPHTYLADSRFHQSFLCSRTGRRVTFADVGQPGGPPVLFFLQSHCSRWVAVWQHMVATAAGVRLIAMDRPGCGGTEYCSLGERVDVACRKQHAFGSSNCRLIVGYRNDSITCGTSKFERLRFSSVLRWFHVGISLFSQ